MAPADSAVVQPPFEADDVAASIVAALRLALPDEAGRLLAGAAVVSADDDGCRVLGFAPGAAVDGTHRPRTLLPLVLADNPAGQGGQRTPIVIVALQTPALVERSLRTVDLHADLATRNR
jgi:asparagine synthase (glutamine-hydrolysing)